jgi:hypothetical protein
MPPSEVARVAPLGNRAAALRAGVPRSLVDEVVGGDDHLLTLPVPAASSFREISSRTPSPHVVALGSKKRPSFVRDETHLSFRPQITSCSD